MELAWHRTFFKKENFGCAVFLLFTQILGLYSAIRAVFTTLIDGRIFIYSCFAQQISFQIDEFEFDLKRNSSGRT